MTHHVSDFLKSVVYLRQFADRYQLSLAPLTVKLEFDDSRDYARFVWGLHQEAFSNQLMYLYKEPDNAKAWYEDFMLMGVNVQLTYRNKDAQDRLQSLADKARREAQVVARGDDAQRQADHDGST